MALSEIDRNLIQRCLARKPRAWEDFVDRFLGLVIHVIRHTGQGRSLNLTPHDCEDLAAEVFLAIVSDDLAVLRRFNGKSSLATYLTVIARRIVVRELNRQRPATNSGSPSNQPAKTETPEERLGNREEVERMLQELQGKEADIVRLYHLEGRSYREISTAIGMPENTIGPTLSRARAKMRASAT